MRDPNRIPEILAMLQQGWEKVPDWRFGQLVENLRIYIGVDDLFYMSFEFRFLKKRIAAFFHIFFEVFQRPFSSVRKINFPLQYIFQTGRF